MTNFTAACIDGISDTVAGMQTTTDPYASETESLATSGAGELQRLRFVIGRVFGFSQWYKHTENVNFGGVGVTKTNVQGAGMGQHVTAVGLHTWAGSQRFPAITGGMRHTTGFFWPAAHHLALAIDPANDADKAGIEMFRFHAQGMTLHHTAAIMFRHSAAWNPQWQYPHITAVSLSRGLVSAAGNEAAGRDTLLFGHAGATLQMVGYGGSHIALGSRGYLALGRHVGTLPSSPVPGALYAETIPKAYAVFAGANGDVSVAFNVAGVTQVSTGYYVVRWIQPFASSNYTVVATTSLSGASPLIAVVEALNAAHANVRVFNFSGTPTDASVFIQAMGTQ